MKGLLYKDFQLILNKVSVTNRLLIVCALLLITIFGRESGAIFLSIMGPIGLASIPTSLLVSDYESGWNRFVGVFPISKKTIVLARYIFCISLIIFVSFITLILSLIVFLLPSVYAFGTFGSTVVNILVLVFIMGAVYILQKTAFGLVFISWISNTNAILLIIASCILIMTITVVSMIISTKIYSSTFNR